MSGTLRLRGSTSGYSELQAPAVAADQTFVLPTAGGTLLTTDSPVPKLTLELGSASQPSLTFQGDTDTGLFSEGTNTLDLVTGGSSKVVLGAAAHTIYAGTGATVRAIDIDSSGHVGIGTTDPGVLLDVAGSNPTLRVKATTANTEVSTFRLTEDNNYVGAYVKYDGSTNLTHIGTHSAADSNAANDNNAITIVRDNRNVGIGTTTPNSYGGAVKLAVASSSNTSLTIASGASSDGTILFADGTSGDATYRGQLKYSHSNDAMLFNTAATERMRIDSSGKVGIGTTSPGRELHVSGVGADGTQLQVQGTSASAGIKLVPNSGDNYEVQAETNSRFSIYNRTDNEYRFVIDSAGNIGIGRTTPGEKLDILSTSGNCLIKMQAPAGSVSGINAIGSNELAFQTGFVEAMRIDSSRRLLVGTSTYSSTRPSGAIHLDSILTTPGFGNISLGFNGTAVGNQNVFTFYRTRGTSAGSVDIVQSGDSLGSINFNGADGVDALSAAASINAEVDGTPGANDMPGRLVFSTTADGSASPTPQMTIKSSGNVGIGTSNPQAALDIGNEGNLFLTSSDNTVEEKNEISWRIEDGSEGAYISAHRTAVANAPHDLAFGTRSSTGVIAERMRIDSSGRLVVGTTSASTNGLLTVQCGTNQDGIVLRAQNAGGQGSQPGIVFEGPTGTELVNIYADNTASELRIKTASTERIRIDDEGIFYHNSSNHGISTSLTQSAGTVKYAFRAHHSATAGAYAGTISFTVWSNGNVQNTNNSYGPISSDERLKQDITDANSQWDDIKNIRIANFHYKNNPTGPLHLGPIAQELEQISPHLVTRRPVSEDEVADSSNSLVDGDEVLSFKASILYMKAVKALQEAIERIETLEQRLTDAGIA